MTKKIYFILILAILFETAPKSLLINELILNISELNHKQILASAATLEYGEYVGKYVDANADDEIEWEFSGTNEYVGIVVRAMTDIDYQKFKSSQTYHYYLLSNGSYYKDDGKFRPNTEDTWYIIFLNLDEDQQITYLTYEASIHRDKYSVSNIDSLMTIIYGIIIISCIIGAPIAISEHLKKKKEEEKVRQDSYNLPSRPHLEKEQSEVKYCPNCGAVRVPNSDFCVNCGEKF